MHKFTQTRQFRTLLAVLFLLCSLSLYTGVAGPGALGDLLSTAVLPMQRVLSLATGQTAESLESITKSKEELQREVDALQSQVNQLNQQQTNYYTALQQNEQYRKFLGLKNENPDYQLLSAAVIERDPTSLSGSFTIDQGSVAGVTQDAPVITEEGLVGWVSQVYATTSVVTTIFDTATQFGGRDTVTNETGILSTTLELSDEGHIRLDYLDADTQVKAGDQIITSGIAVDSGLGGLFPGGLLVGTVTEVGHSTEDASLYAEVAPYVDPAEVRNVMVITDFEGKEAALQDAASSQESGG